MLRLNHLMLLSDELRIQSVSIRRLINQRSCLLFHKVFSDTTLTSNANVLHYLYFPTDTYPNSRGAMSAVIHTAKQSPEFKLMHINEFGYKTVTLSS